MFDEKQIFFPRKEEQPLLTPCKISAGDWKSGLLVRSPNWLGDAVMTFPALKQLKMMLPETCGLVVQAPQGLVPLYEALTCVDQVLPLHDGHAFPNKRERYALAKIHFGAGILFNNSFRDALALFLAKVHPLFGASARFRDILLKRAWNFPPRQDHVLNKPHQALKYTAMAAALGAPEWDGIMPEMKTIRPDQANPETQKLCGTDAPLLVLAGGAAYGDAKRWAPENFRETAIWWVRERGGIAVAVGSGKEAAAAEEICRGLPEDKVVNLAGQTSLDELMLLLRQASLCIANDSGVMHLAAALGTKGVAIFASTDPAATSPLSQNWILLYEKQSCSPCFKRECPLGTRACFEALTAEKAIEAAKKLL